MATEKELPSHLKSLFENTSSDLTETEKKKLSNLVFEFQDVFMSPDWQLKQTHLAEHYIDTGENQTFQDALSQNRGVSHNWILPISRDIGWPVVKV